MPTGNVFAAAIALDAPGADVGAPGAAAVGTGVPATESTGWVAPRATDAASGSRVAGTGGLAAVNSPDATPRTESRAGFERAFGPAVSAPLAPGA